MNKYVDTCSPHAFMQPRYVTAPPLHHRALVLDRFRMEITGSGGEFFVADASKGHVMLTISSGLASDGVGWWLVVVGHQQDARTKLHQGT